VRFIRYTDHHDTAHGPVRVEKLWGHAGSDAALALIFTLDGVAFSVQRPRDRRRCAPQYFHAHADRLVADRHAGGAGAARFVQDVVRAAQDGAGAHNGRVVWVESDCPSGFWLTCGKRRRASPHGCESFGRRGPRSMDLSARNLPSSRFGRLFTD
jgi:hypothetical protein